MSGKRGGKKAIIRAGQEGARPLFILAGLPRSTAMSVPIHLERLDDLRPAHYLAGLAPERRPWYQKQSVDSLLIQATRFILGESRRIDAKGTPGPAPTRVYLLYVPGSMEDVLLSGFEHFVWPTRIEAADTVWDEFRQSPDVWRAFATTVRDILSGRNGLAELESTITASYEAVVKLPPRNFTLDPQTGYSCVQEVLRQLARGAISLSRAEALTRAARYNSEQMPYHAKGKKRVYAFADQRDRVYPPDPSRHSLPRMLPEGATPEVCRRLLNQAYRLGCPLPPGYHHDVQKVGSQLVDEPFTCSERGAIRVSATHANVYPNDYVREG